MTAGLVAFPQHLQRFQLSRILVDRRARCKNRISSWTRPLDHPSPSRDVVPLATYVRRDCHFVCPIVISSPERLPQFLWIMSPRRLYKLDRSSTQFPDRLYQLLHDKEHVECLQKLPKDEVVQLIDYLNDVRLSLMSAKWH